MENEQSGSDPVITVTMNRRVTEKAREAARKNGAKSKDVVTSEEHRAKLRAAWTRPRAEDKCNCGRTDGTHAGKCPAYAAWKQRESRARKAKQETQTV